MDIKGILRDMAERCEKDSSFKQLVENDFGEALKSCGVDSVAQFVQAIKDEGLLTDEDMANVSGGTSHPNAVAVTALGTSLGIGGSIGIASILAGVSAVQGATQN